MGTVMQTVSDPVIAQALSDLKTLSERKQGGGEKLNQLLGSLAQEVVQNNPSLKRQLGSDLQGKLTDAELAQIRQSLEALPNK